jgi:hypothetical protein
MYNREIIITEQMEGYHYWPQAPKNVGFLREIHRHMFHVRVGIPVSKNNREREFFQEKKVLRTVLKKIILPLNEVEHKFYSCEEIAENILNKMPQAEWAEVWEDNENGSRVSRIQE